MLNLHNLVFIVAGLLIVFLLFVHFDRKKKEEAGGNSKQKLPILVAIYAFILFLLAIAILFLFGIFTDASLSVFAMTLFWGIKFVLPVLLIATGIGLLGMKKWSYYLGIFILLLLGYFKLHSLWIYYQRIHQSPELLSGQMIIPFVWFTFLCYFIAIRKKFTRKQLPPTQPISVTKNEIPKN